MPSGAEACNGIDDDCDGSIDEEGAAGCQVFFKDADADGWGIASDFKCLCAPAAGYSAKQTQDCNDADPLINPAEVEVCNGVDDNCSGTVDETPGICGDCSVELFNGHSYYFCVTPADWGSAQSDCAGLGTHLVTINNTSENAFLFGIINTHSGGKWWMGLNDRAQEGTFVWEDGSPLNYTNWQPGEPNNAGGNEDCAQLNRFNPAFTWNDEPCSEAFPYVCESF